jgi:integrase
MGKASQAKLTLSLQLDRRSKREDGTYPVKLRLLFQRDFKRYGTGLFASDTEWEKLQLPRPRGKLTQAQLAIESLRQKTEAFKHKAQTILDSLAEFSYSAFEKQWFNQQPAPATDAYVLFSEHIEQLKAEKRISTARSYRDTMHSLERFKRSLKADQITVDFLKKYEQWLVGQGKTLTTVGIYARNIRTIVNQAIARGVLKPEAYPFHSRKGGYSIPVGHSIKRALSESDLTRLLSYRPEDEYGPQAKALDFFVLSYLANGANFKDICRWRYKNIQAEQLIFLRAKTERTTRKKPMLIKVFLSERIKAIIDKWGNKPVQPESYIFPVLRPDMDAETERGAISQLIKTCNKYLKRIGKELNIESELTTYTARHSFATRLKRKGASTEFIKESLGHQNILTTENYLDSFEDSERVKWANLLLE